MCMRGMVDLGGEGQRNRQRWAEGRVQVGRGMFRGWRYVEGWKGGRVEVGGGMWEGWR